MSTDLSALVFSQIKQDANPIATAKGISHLYPVDEGNLGDFPWFWQSGTNFNAATYNWLDNLFSYQENGYIGTAGQALMTAYYNVLMATSYVLDASDNDALNAANLNASNVVNTVINEQIALFGPIPVTYTTESAQLNFIMTEVLSWGNPGLTLNQLRTSTNPMALLPNVPLGASQLVSDVMTYLAETSSVANIQAAVVSNNAQLSQMRLNASSTVPPLSTPPTAASPGYMQTVDTSGKLQVVPQFTITESTGTIQNNLLPTSGGSSFSSTFTATASTNDTVNISCRGGSAQGLSSFFLSFGGSTSTTATLFSADSSLTTCQVTLTYNGCTTITPVFSAYNVSTCTGWWNPLPIEEAANPPPNQSGYIFNPGQQYNFGVNGNFGVLSRLLISQQPIITLVYTTSNYSLIQQTFEQHSSWGCSFLGIHFGGGSKSYYQSTVTQDASSNTVTVTMTPVGLTVPITATAQLATVVGAEILWPGASATQNASAI